MFMHIGMGAWMMDDERLSKELANVLRHKLQKKSIEFAPDGFACLSDVLRLKRFYDVHTEDVERVVKHSRHRSDGAPRFELQYDCEELRIRATRHHTIAGIDLVAGPASPSGLRSGTESSDILSSTHDAWERYIDPKTKRAWWENDITKSWDWEAVLIANEAVHNSWERYRDSTTGDVWVLDARNRRWAWESCIARELLARYQLRCQSQ